MDYKQVRVDSVLNKITSKDKLFIGNYTIDPYQNCEFGCRYCDSSFDKTIYIKSNAAEVLKKQLKNNEEGRIIVGSVHDPYQNAEKDFKITRKILETISNSDFSAHILTKSDLVLRDLDVLKRIDDCIVTVSIASLNENFSEAFEGNVLKPSKRLELIKKLNGNGVKSGVSIIPVLPYIVDENLEELIKSSKEHNAGYVLYKYLELKGNQKHIFVDILKQFYPNLVEKYKMLYSDSFMPNESYISELNKKMAGLIKKYSFKKEI